MENEMLFEFMTKMYDEMQRGFKSVNEQFKVVNERLDKVEGDVSSLKSDVSSLKSDVSSLKSDVQKLGAKIDGEVTDKLKILSEEQSIMRKDIADIKELQSIHNTKIDDLTIAVNNLTHSQKQQEKEIWELRKVK